MAFTDLREELNCSICLNIYTDPVTLRCGHNFCRVCITQMLNTNDLCGRYTCPQCRKRFSARPTLQKNTTLCNIVKHFHPFPSEKMMDDIFCTYCIESRVPAAKSCLLCEASLCINHLSVHSKSPEHVVMEPITFCKKRKCSVHTQILDYFSAEDASCIYCQAGAHRKLVVDQQTKPFENKKLKNILDKLISKRQRIADKIHILQNHRIELQKNAAQYSLQTAAIFVDIKKQLQILERRILNEIMRQEEQVLLSASNMIKQLEVKKRELTQQIMHIEALFNTLTPFKVSEPERIATDNAENEETDSRLETWDEKFRAVGDMVGVLLSETLHRDLFDIVANVKPLFCGLEAVDVLLDANTAGCDVVVSANKRTASWSRIHRKCPKNPERFQYYNQILNTKSFPPGRYYLEVETSKVGNWRIGVAYPSADRESRKSRIGDNNKSWCLCRWKNEYSVRHDDRKTSLSRKVLCSKVGLYLNIWAGILSFYELGDPIEHLYTFTTTFSESIHIALCVGLKGCLTIRSKKYPMSTSP